MNHSTTCKDCPWLRGVTDIGAAYCPQKDTMVFVTDPACQRSKVTPPIGMHDVWVSYGDTGPTDKSLTMFFHRPVWHPNKGYIDPEPVDRSRYDAEFGCQFSMTDDITDSEEYHDMLVRVLLPELREIQGTRKLLRVTVEVIDQ